MASFTVERLENFSFYGTKDFDYKKKDAGMFFIPTKRSQTLLPKRNMKYILK